MALDVTKLDFFVALGLEIVLFVGVDVLVIRVVFVVVDTLFLYELCGSLL